MKNKIKISLELLRLIWSLGFTSGRVYGKRGATYDDETPLWNEDIKRLKSLYPTLYSEIRFIE